MLCGMILLSNNIYGGNEKNCDVIFFNLWIFWKTNGYIVFISVAVFVEYWFFYKVVFKLF